MQEIFRLPAEQSVALLRTAADMLRRWQAAYMEMRLEIEDSGRDARWEFSKTLLFERTTYMAEASTRPLRHCCLPRAALEIAGRTRGSYR